MSDLHGAIRAELTKLDGTQESILAVMTGMSVDEIKELGGIAP